MELNQSCFIEKGGNELQFPFQPPIQLLPLDASSQAHGLVQVFHYVSLFYIPTIHPGQGFIFI